MEKSNKIIFNLTSIQLVGIILMVFASYGFYSIISGKNGVSFLELLAIHAVEPPFQTSPKTLKEYADALMERDVGIHVVSIDSVIRAQFREYDFIISIDGVKLTIRFLSLDSDSCEDLLSTGRRDGHCGESFGHFEYQLST